MPNQLVSVRRASGLASRLLRLFNTLSNLKLRQLVFLILRRGIKLPYHLPCEMEPINPTFQLPCAPHDNHCIQADRFIFLNTLATFTLEKVRWRGEAMSKLWRYNLHYFDYLSAQLERKTKDFLIQHWIENNPYPCEDAWEPYPVSLRIINWIKYFHQNPSKPLPNSWLLSLYRQGHYLTRHIEWHIDANHLLKNIIALVLWSHFFNGAHAQHWRSRSCTLLKTIAQEQFNADGGHYERSPMYHSILLFHLLDAYSCIQHNSNTAPTWLHKLITNAIIFNQIMAKPDGTFPLIKDSAHAIAPTLGELTHYASQLGIFLPPDKSAPTTAKQFFLPQTGYFIKKTTRDYLLFDVGNITPNHQPGHAHCDALHVELFFNGRSIFTDSGVFCYVASAERHYSRSVRAHNTLSIDGQEQHEIWDAFRIGKRGKMHNVKTGDNFCSAEFTPFSKRHTRHERCVSTETLGEINIVDRVLGIGTASVEIFWHLAPGLTPTVHPGAVHIHDETNTLVSVMKLQHNQVIPIVMQSDYFPEFGLRNLRYCLVFKAGSAELPWQLGYQISKFG